MVIFPTWCLLAVAVLIPSEGFYRSFLFKFRHEAPILLYSRDHQKDALNKKPSITNNKPIRVEDHLEGRRLAKVERKTKIQLNELSHPMVTRVRDLDDPSRIPLSALNVGDKVLGRIITIKEYVMLICFL